ncbi:hypothetical protein PUNSTDRAFT_141050 [Punctularia strigosozonata HHB-11173 SS5]|uniref:uncharacterized protein n=1 Tax=Punctularia strigosozonata (strain HHB-11173) TaxID=741275 RepID=UPI0004417EA2|nr:uncharacterized protein PUNSTDRAFT_141050 [Punctularia strigosozonata HHB-11173 SS5]EIN12296.1 hypothetical protein PUNSTDRAFT_141050 [Punctularia strigosozonata HHB-11173 SS5]
MISHLIPQPALKKKSQDTLIKRMGREGTPFADKFERVTYDMRKLVQERLQPGEVLCEQAPVAVADVIEKICNKYPIFRQYENAWPVTEYLDRYCYVNRHRADWPRAMLQSSKLRSRRWHSPPSHRQGNGAIVWPAYEEQDEDLIDLSRDSEDIEELYIVETNDSAHLSNTTSASAFRASGVHSPLSVSMHQHIQPYQKPPPPATHGTHRTVGPSSSDDHMHPPAAILTGRPYFVGCPPSCVPSTSASQPETSQNTQNDEVDPLHALLSSQRRSLSHLRPVLQELGVIDQEAIECLYDLGDEQRDAWLDTEMKGARIGATGAAVTALDLLCLKRAFAQGQKMSNDSKGKSKGKENIA